MSKIILIKTAIEPIEYLIWQFGEMINCRIDKIIETKYGIEMM